MAVPIEQAQLALQQLFGYEDFRAGQREVVEALLSGRDVLAVMPTGAGKSVCYQIPAVVMRGVALVVSPLVSLMGDQVRNLAGVGISAAYVNSSMTLPEQRDTLKRAQNGEFDLLYVAPERLGMREFIDFARNTEIPLVAIDEAHCVSQWGQDFRSAYLEIGDFLRDMPRRPTVAALTATATERVRRDIVRLLGLNDPLMVVKGFDRPNLHFAVERLQNKRKLAYIIDYARNHAKDCGVVYCTTRKDVESVHESLVGAGVLATRYHAGLTSAERSRNQRAWVTDETRVMVATNAFGMGIDKPDVRYVIHYGMPLSMEAYYQEAGRAGRDGLPGECVLLWNDGDLSTCRFFLSQDSGNENMTPEEAQVALSARRRMLAAMEGYCLTRDCLREYMLRYFGDDETGQGAGCGNCSNCTDEVRAVDVTGEARAVMRCVQELRGEFGKGTVVDLLRGTNKKKLEDMGLAGKKSFGAVSTPEPQLKEIVELLAAGGYLQFTEGRYPLLGFGPRFREAASPDFHLEMKRIERSKRPSSTARGATRAGGLADVASGSIGADEALFEQLRALRAEVAKEAGIPAYMVFSNATLIDMSARKPKTPDEMLEVSGVGEKKLEAYGRLFLTAIEEFSA